MRAKINGNEVVIYGFNVNSNGVPTAECYVKDIGLKFEYPLSIIDIVSED